MKYSKAYIAVVGLLFAGMAVVFDYFPRSGYSELEKRALKRIPVFSVESLLSGQFTEEMSSWFSDSEPYRDHLMALSMHIKDLMRLEIGGEENITFHAGDDFMEQEPAHASEHTGDSPSASESVPDEREGDFPDEHEETGTETSEGAFPEVPEVLEENAKIAHAGIIIVGTGERVRALMAYGGTAKGCTGYARAANKYKETFPDVNVYCMVIPTAVEYYCPEKVRNRTRPQRPTIDNVIAHLDPGVKVVDIYETLGRHAGEDIFLRTDHHWAPLGAFYAAEKFAKVAGVPFRQLQDYERKVVHGYVGSMYGYSKDVAVKKAPEDFVYYVPKGVSYTTTYQNYSIDENYHVIGMGRPYKGPFFYRFKDGSGGAYCTFMGSDTKITQVRTSTGNGRRLLILKDSFGNALPGYLFFSFEEVHVVDSRYFTKNMVAYVRDNGITDILFANNIFKAYSSSTYGKYLKFLTQSGGISVKRDSVKVQPPVTTGDKPSVVPTEGSGATSPQDSTASR